MSTLLVVAATLAVRLAPPAPRSAPPVMRIPRDAIQNPNYSADQRKARRIDAYSPFAYGSSSTSGASTRDGAAYVPHNGEMLANALAQALAQADTLARRAKEAKDVAQKLQQEADAAAEAALGMEAVARTREEEAARLEQAAIRARETATASDRLACEDEAKAQEAEHAVAGLRQSSSYGYAPQGAAAPQPSDFYAEPQRSRRRPVEPPEERFPAEPYPPRGEWEETHPPSEGAWGAYGEPEPYPPPGPGMGPGHGGYRGHYSRMPDNAQGSWLPDVRPVR